MRIALFAIVCFGPLGHVVDAGIIGNDSIVLERRFFPLPFALSNLGRRQENNPENDQENNEDGDGEENNPEDGEENNPEDGQENNPEDGEENNPEDGEENNPEDGQENNPEDGQENNPEDGQENNEDGENNEGEQENNDGGIPGELQDGINACRNLIQQDPQVGVAQTFVNLNDDDNNPFKFAIEIDEENQNCVPGVIAPPIPEGDVNGDEIAQFCPDFEQAQGLDLTDGEQKVQGSYSATIIGMVSNQQTRCKITRPLLMEVVDTAFRAEAQCIGYATSVFIDPNEDYYRDPLLLVNADPSEVPIGHIHITCEFVGDGSVNQSAKDEGNDFGDFKGVNKGDVNNLFADLEMSQPTNDGDNEETNIREGVARCTILPSGMGHQCLVLSQIERSAEFDSVYFIVQNGGDFTGLAFEPTSGGQIFQG